MIKLQVHPPVVIALIVIQGALAASAGAAVRTVALTGQQAPDAPAGALFDDLFTSITTDPVAPSMNAAGRTAFAATLATGAGGVAGPNDTGIWSEGGGALSLWAREGFAAPGGPAGANFLRVLNPVLNNTGQLAFSGRMRDGGVATTNDDGIWSSGPGNLALIAREGSAAPGTPDGVLFSVASGASPFLDPALGHGGATAFRATVSGTGITTANNTGIWVHRSGALLNIMRIGTQAPGLPMGVNFSTLLNNEPRVNAAGQVAFRARLTGPGVTITNDGTIWVERGGALTAVAREGNAAPGAGAGVTFLELGDFVLNSLGQTAFTASLVGSGQATNAGVWAENGGTLGLVVQKGSAATGAGTGVSFNSFSNPLFNSSGDVGFASVLAGTGVVATNDTSVWARRDGTLGLVAREGALAPGAAAGQNFGAFGELAFNSAGQTAFLATLVGTGITTGNDNGIWAQSSAGELRLIAREGDMLQVAPGQNRTISELFFAGAASNEDGRRSGLNDRGEVGFLATFTDGTSGVFVSDVVKSSIAGDFDGDGDADGADFLAWQRGFGTATGATTANGDANGDGAVTGADLGIWGQSFGDAASVIAAAPVPEPAAIVLAAMATVAIMARRRAS